MLDITLEMYEEGEVSAPGIISSGNMGPCISIGIFDTKSKNGYMRHQPNCNHDEDMENFIINTLKKINKNDAKVYICGGSYSKYEEKSILKNTRNSRKHMKYLAEKHFDKNQVTIKWVKKDFFSELILYTANGKFELELEKIEYNDEDDSSF